MGSYTGTMGSYTGTMGSYTGTMGSYTGTMGSYTGTLGTLPYKPVQLFIVVPSTSIVKMTDDIAVCHKRRNSTLGTTRGLRDIQSQQ